MADVLIVCVREDEPQAKALADMFEAAGFSIGGAPNSDGALRSSGAGVVVWSQASIRSRPFLDAAQRVINANKAVVASLIEPPPPSSVGESPAFDLSRWDGDPNDPALDPLFFAVDRMVNAARAGVGAAQRETQDFDPPPRAPRQTALRAEPPPRRQEPPQYRAPPAEPTPSYRVPPQSDPLGSEAEHWRAIRDSRNPTDFMDYLARYGPDGAFSEVAELRLKQLTGPGEARESAPKRPAVRPPPPAPRAEAPPMRRAEPPPRRPDALPPTQRRLEPPPQASRRPPIDRDYTRDLRDPPRGQGGPLRAFVLIALLGGAALIGGIYFGGGMGGPRPAATERQVEPQPAQSESADNDFSALEEAPSVPLSDAVTNRADRQTQTAARTPEREPPRTTREEPQRTVEREQPRRDPPVTTSAANNAATASGPVSLSPTQTQDNQGAVPLNPQPIPPVQTANVEPSILGSATPPQPRAPAGNVVWTQRPSARRISDLYPRSALNDGVGGRVVLSCRILGDLSASCSVASETPSGAGFGRAALSASSSYRARATLSDGSSAIGSTTRIAVNFQAPQR
ncbi:MAG: toll/interleukin-1 receptor domain-containing protein [Hyphomonadaceae bacterium]|nr:toll/interleukin-1 receptor domain-containing protein [Hyphomonadaceae bacterium]